jgi:hypothetical protein
MSDVETMSLSPPPRAVPLDLSVRVVLGGVLGQVGWSLVGFGFLFVWAFDADGAVVSAFRFIGSEEVVQGTTTSWRELPVRVNEVPVFETSYAFEVDGRRIAGVSYATGHYVPEGTVVVVEYRDSNPETSRIQGMRATSVGLAIAFALAIPLIGLALVRAALRKGFRARRLLSEGHLARAAFVSEEETGARVNEKPVRRLTFEFAAESGGTYRVVATTHETHRLRDEETERVVYDPRYPSDAVLIDDLPGRPEIDPHGNFASGGPRGTLLALLSLVVPTLTVVGHGLFLFLTR